MESEAHGEAPHHGTRGPSELVCKLSHAQPTFIPCLQYLLDQIWSFFFSAKLIQIVLC